MATNLKNDYRRNCRKRKNISQQDVSNANQMKTPSNYKCSVILTRFDEPKKFIPKKAIISLRRYDQDLLDKSKISLRSKNEKIPKCSNVITTKNIKQESLVTSNISVHNKKEKIAKSSKVITRKNVERELLDKSNISLLNKKGNIIKSSNAVTRKNAEQESLDKSKMSIRKRKEKNASQELLDESKTIHKKKEKITRSSKVIAKSINGSSQNVQVSRNKHIPVYRKLDLKSKQRSPRKDPYELDLPTEKSVKKPLPKKRKYTRKKNVKNSPGVRKNTKSKQEKNNGKPAQMIIFNKQKLLIDKHSHIATIIESHHKTGKGASLMPKTKDIKSTNKQIAQSNLRAEMLMNDIFSSIINSKANKTAALKLNNNQLNAHSTLRTAAAKIPNSPLEAAKSNTLFKSSESINNIPCDDEEHMIDNSEGEFFGFEEDILPSDDERTPIHKIDQNNETIHNTSKRINIISNVLLSKPLTNLTVQNISKSESILDTSEEGSPWRLNFSACKRNVTDRIKRPPIRDTVPVMSTPKVAAGPKKQKTLSNFVINTPKKTPEKTISNVSLYGDFIDNYHLSPLKNKENVFRKHKQQSHSDCIENFFGFDKNDTVEFQRPLIARSTPLKELNANSKLPVRFLLRSHKPEDVRKSLEKSFNNEEKIVMEEPNITIPEENMDHFALFDDPEVTFTEPTRRSYKFKPRKRCVSFNRSSDYEDDEEIHKEPVKKKRKNAKDIAREEEYNRWAEQFNSMCEDIEKHELSVE